MANPDIGSLATLRYDIDIKALTTTTSTIVAEVATGEVHVIESIAIAGIANGSFTMNLNHGTTAFIASAQVTGFQTTLLGNDAKNVLTVKEGSYVTGNASANSSVNVFVNKRVMT